MSQETGSAETDNSYDAVMSELSGHYFEDLDVGLSAVYSRTITESDIVLFCGISGDTNPVHLNQEYASRTRFRGRIAHGMLSASPISTILGTKLPGPGAIYVNQTLAFKAPVRAGDTITARATVEELNAKKKHAKIKTTCSVGGKVVVDGQAIVLVPSRADA